MSYEHINYVRDYSKTKGPALLLLLTIATRTDDNGYAFPSLTCLAKDTRMSIRSVRRALTQIPKDEIAITQGGSEKGQKRRAALYRIKMNESDRAPNAHSTNNDRAQYAHSGNDKVYGDRAPIDTGPCAVGPTTVRNRAPDHAPNAHLTVIEQSKEQSVEQSASPSEFFVAEKEKTEELPPKATPTPTPTPKPSDAKEQLIERQPKEWKPPSLETVKSYANAKGWTMSFAKHCWNKWAGSNWKHYGETIKSDEQWQCLMATMEYNP